MIQQETPNFYNMNNLVISPVFNEGNKVLKNYEAISTLKKVRM